MSARKSKKIKPNLQRAVLCKSAGLPERCTSISQALFTSFYREAEIIQLYISEFEPCLKNQRIKLSNWLEKHNDAFQKPFNESATDEVADAHMQEVNVKDESDQLSFLPDFQYNDVIKSNLVELLNKLIKDVNNFQNQIVSQNRSIPLLNDLVRIIKSILVGLGEQDILSTLSSDPKDE